MPPIPAPLASMRVFSRSIRPVPHQISRLALPKPFRSSPCQQHLFTSRFSTKTPFRLPNSPRPLTDAPPISSNTHKPTQVRPPQPEYQITFTCTPCSTRSTHKISKQGYHHGSVLITCPECRNRHIISDHLNIFGDRNITIEDLMRERGQLVKKGTLSEDGDLEFWEDGSVSEAQGAKEAKEVIKDEEAEK